MTGDYKLSTTSPAQWDAFIGSHPRAHVLQQAAWGELKTAFGWQAERISLTNQQDEMVAAAQLLFRRLPFRLGTMAYLAMGPLVSHKLQVTSRKLEDDLWEAIDTVSRKHHAAFLKWEPGIISNSAPSTQYSALGFHPSPQTVQ